ncbi:MAG: 1-acyl-sn-glycerol-3-phosphate acyltransferase, partial [Bacteroidales bacterium]|nr:1-acyl-sn-glycerol-3-phosphate acyltransferase [Bacteroidales bacterium]
MQRFCKWIFFKLMRWNFVDNFPDNKKLILIIAPHTSNMDFLMGKLIFCVLGKKPHFMIKEQWFRPPVGWLIKALGGVPVNRTSSSGMVKSLIEHLQNDEEFILNITPEGTRSRVKRWKRGFYKLSLQTGIPILPGYIDYGKKEIGVGKLIYPTGNYDADSQYFKLFYKNVTARHP